MDAAFLTNQFLIAMPSLADPNFARTVTYICEHNESGAMGIVVNRPVDLSLGDLLGDLDIAISTPNTANQAVFLGGPVQTERGFVLHSPLGSWQSTLPITDGIGLSISRDVLDAMAQGHGPERSLIALGYAGWGPGQLEAEIRDNAWLNGPADPDVLFNLPAEQRWEAAAAALGVDLSLLSADAGHA
ncbi:MAG: YqgE/AlgH family protein [Gammaproteobacteria bacterium]